MLAPPSGLAFLGYPRPTMTSMPHTTVQPQVLRALRARKPVVALESTLITHGLPRPVNLETARAAEAAVREAGAVPATIAVLDGTIRVGLTSGELQRLAQDSTAMKASRRDLALAVQRGRTAGTTVAATMFLAHQTGIRVFATGGIGGVHRGFEESHDVSADLRELARTPVCVVCAGAKIILDLPRTLEVLESLGVPVIGHQTDDFPAFYVRESGLAVDARIDTAQQMANFLRVHWELGGQGVVLAQPPPADVALEPREAARALQRCERAARVQGVRGKELTPFLLQKLANETQNKSLIVNQALIVANARLAGEVACCLQA